MYQRGSCEGRRRTWRLVSGLVRRRGATEQQITESLERRRAYDHDALLGDQLRWLRDAGFARADCVYKNWFVGVFLAVRPNRP